MSTQGSLRPSFGSVPADRQEKLSPVGGSYHLRSRTTLERAARSDRSGRTIAIMAAVLFLIALAVVFGSRWFG